MVPKVRVGFAAFSFVAELAWAAVFLEGMRYSEVPPQGGVPIVRGAGLFRECCGSRMIKLDNGTVLSANSSVAGRNMVLRAAYILLDARQTTREVILSNSLERGFIKYSYLCALYDRAPPTISV
jgi:hypothetical protein